MTFWILASLIALSVALWLINGLRLARGNRSEAESDMGVYRDQLAEVDRDLARRVLTETEAETIRTEVARRLQAGVVWCNTYHCFDAASPFGGYRESGFGREGGMQGLRAYVQLNERSR